MTEELAGLDGWAGLRTVVKVRRETWGRDRQWPTVEEAYAISSLGLDRCTPARFLRLSREHWHIENRLHWVLDVSMGEDACRVSKGRSPLRLHDLRNVALGVLRRLGRTKIAASLRRNAARPLEALAMVGIR